MAESIKILKTSFHAFFRSYHCFTFTAAFLVFPYSVAVLLSQSVPTSSSSLLRAISSRIWLLLEASQFPASDFFSLLDVKLSQAMFSFISTLPFAVTFLLLAKASVLQIILQGRSRPPTPSLASLLRLYPSLLLTFLSNSFLVLSANAAVLSLLFLVFNVVDILDISSTALTLTVSVAGITLYSLVLANAVITCNMSTVITAMENIGGHLAILEALVLVQGKMATAMGLALPASLGAATVEALFQHRVMGPYLQSGKLRALAIWEALSIAYMYSLLLVFDTIVTYNFVKSCKSEEKDVLQI